MIVPQYRPTVLIVDDEPTNLSIMAQTLKDSYNLLIATNGADALQRATADPQPEVILLDVIMPNMNGFEVCRKLKADERTQSIPVIFTTAMCDSVHERRGLEAGAVDYIMKPFNPTILRERIKRLFESQEDFVRKPNLLIVDDVPLNLEIVANILKGQDWNLYLATSGEQALEKTRQMLFDLVLLDVMMPGLDGLEVCRRLKSSPSTRDIPVIMLTAKTDPESVIQGFDAGAQDYVAKPFNDRELLARVRIHLDLRQKSEQIKREKEKSERLLLNVLPRKVAQDLRESGRTEVEEYEDVTVMFADIVGFTRQVAGLPPRLVINELNEIFTAFDEIATANDCERIKTIGDAYLAVCGMPEPNPRHAEAMLRTALELRDYLKRRNSSREPVVAGGWQMRFGLHTGEAVGGVVGIKKYIYDIFGDAINTAARVESHCRPMEINVSAATRGRAPTNFRFQEREPIEVKSKGLLPMFYFEGINA
jgi:DNA-binding response OmpR family regulator